jgi:ketosteroid isomerase-like protein
MKCVALHTRILGLFLCLWFAPSPVYAQPEDPAHAQLRAMRDDLIDAVNKRDMDRVLGHLHPNVVVTWQNAEVSRKPEGVRAYMSRMLDGPDSIVRSFNTSIAVDELTILHGGDTGIAFGSSRDRFELRAGRTFELTGRWSATVVLDGGAWKIASFHSSTNLFDNPLLNAARRLLIVVGAVAAVAGILVGFLFARLRNRRTAL